MSFKFFYLLSVILLIKSCLSVQLEDVRVYEKSSLKIKDAFVNITINDNSTQFFVIGDWGGLPVFPYRTIVEQTVAAEMKKLSLVYNTQFQLALGDNFYFDGVQNVDDRRFYETFEQVFNVKNFNDPWLVIMGNHDHYGNSSAQIEYTKKSKRWILPDYNYTVNVNINNGNDNLIQIIMLDTILMCGNSGYDINNLQPKFVSLQEEQNSSKYFQALEQQLKSISDSQIPYLLVTGHFPVWSIAEHGPTQCLVDKLRPLLHKYQVSAYLCGHDHSLQYISDTYLDATVEYFVSGSSNFVQNSTDHIKSIPEGSLKFFWAEAVDQLHGAFLVAEANKDNMTLTFVETTGKTLYQKVIYPRKTNLK